MSSPAKPWRSPLVLLPEDGATVYIRRLPFYDRPVLADWSFDLFTFTVQQIPTQDTPPQYADHSIPVVSVHSWRAQ